MWIDFAIFFLYALRSLTLTSLLFLSFLFIAPSSVTAISPRSFAGAVIMHACLSFMPSITRNHHCILSRFRGTYILLRQSQPPTNYSVYPILVFQYDITISPFPLDVEGMHCTYLHMMNGMYEVSDYHSLISDASHHHVNLISENISFD